MPIPPPPVPIAAIPTFLTLGFLATLMLMWFIRTAKQGDRLLQEIKPQYRQSIERRRAREKVIPLRPKTYFFD
jgi:hypothetical protein